MDRTKQLITKQKVQQEVYKLQGESKIISQVEFSEKYGISRASFYNWMKEWGIDISKYNKNIREEQLEETIEETKKDPITSKFTFKVNENFLKSNEKKNDFSISKRENFWDNKPVEIKEEVKREAAEAEEVKVPEMIGDEEVHDFASENKPFIIAGLISQRHDNIDNGTKIFVYNGPIRSSLVHDYEWLYSQADTFIKEKVIGAGYQKLKLVVTGLTQAVTAVIKAAYDNQISLVLMHYDNSILKYREQVMFGDNEEANTSLINLFASIKRNYQIKLVGKDLKHYQSLDKLYTVKIENLSDKFSSPVVYITDDMNTMFKIYSDSVQKIMSIKFESYRVGADELIFGTTKSEFKFPNSFGVYYNMPKN